jgi:dienelactone hydrolase
VKVKTEDGAILEADEWVPGAGDPPAAGILLIHSLGSSRKSWVELPRALARAGYRVLAIDLRGHGGSSSFVGDPDRLQTDPALAPNDMRAGLAWLRAAPGADGSRLGVIGADLGGNLACVASGLGLARAAVAIEPHRDRVHLLAGHRQLHMQSILFLAGTGDPGREAFARRLGLEARAPKDVHMFPGQGEPGEALIAAHPESIDMILDWLHRTL